jgi:hypothetical protein
VTLLRLIPGAKLFLQPSAAEHTARRNAEADRLAEFHRQRAVELADYAAEALAQQQHHERMAEVYRKRATVQVLRRVEA